MLSVEPHNHPELDCFSKDCRLPIQLQRAMAAEAEAAREARAKVCPICSLDLDQID